MRAIRVLLKAEREKVNADEALCEAGKKFQEEARQSVKGLRKETYWGTYLLVEAQARQAFASKRDSEYDETPPHRLTSRLGVHFLRGIGVDGFFACTLTRVEPLPSFRQRASGVFHARGKAARTTLSFRVGSVGKGKPLFAEFPMIMHRPLPPDARIKDAYVVRRANSVRVPWRYCLCVVLESGQFEAAFSSSRQVGTTAVNFGWRLVDGEIRVATVNNDVGGTSEVRLPARFLGGVRKCEDLQGILDKNFDEVRATIATWIAGHDCPEAFRDTFAGVASWESQHRLAELAWYWRERRFDGDDEIYDVVTGWKDRYRHLADWLKNERRYLVDWRANFYSVTAKRLATTSARIAIDTFQISKVARRAQPEEREQGGDAARANRVIAAPSLLRLAILHAASKYHCEVVVAPTANGTRRCDVCGFIHPTKIVEMVHVCSGCGAVWDQDVNNTDNLLAKNASALVVPFVRPAEIKENGETASGSTETFRGARKKLANG